MFSSPTLPLSPLGQAIKRTKSAAAAAYFSAVLSTIIVIAASYAQKNAEPLFMLADAALVAGLGFGVGKHSRICATFLVIYWVYAKWDLWRESPPGLFAIALGIGFGLIFVGGLIGAVNYHRFKDGPNKSVQTTAMTPPPSTTRGAPLSDL